MNNSLSPWEWGSIVRSCNIMGERLKPQNRSDPKSPSLCVRMRAHTVLLNNSVTQLQYNAKFILEQKLHRKVYNKMRENSRRTIAEAEGTKWKGFIELPAHKGNEFMEWVNAVPGFLSFHSEASRYHFLLGALLYNIPAVVLLSCQHGNTSSLLVSKHLFLYSFHFSSLLHLK